MPLSTLRLKPHGANRKTQGQDGVRFLLSCETLSSSTTCRFIPAHPQTGFELRTFWLTAGVFEPLCLRVFSAFCDLLALSACGTDGAGECRGCTGLVPLKIARRWFRSHAGRLLADRLRSTRPAPDFAALLR